MPTGARPDPAQEDYGATRAVCIHTRKIYDSCRAKDCAEDVRVYLTQSTLPALELAGTIKAKDIELLWVSTEVEELTFNRGYYTVDMTFYYRVRFDVCNPAVGSGELEGLCLFSKRVILFGSEGSVKVFSSDSEYSPFGNVSQPVAVVEAVDPIVLRTRISDCPIPQTCLPCVMPPAVTAAFAGPLNFDNGRWLLVTLGQFSIVRLERDAQISIPSYDYCIPEENCALAEEEDPCTLFSRISFPTDEFFPPNSISDGCGCREE